MHKLTIGAFGKAPAENREAGYSLIQIAIGMVILGIFAGTAGHAYVVYTKKKQWQETQQNVQELAEKIDVFRQAFNRLPCPAEMDVARDNADYGDEAPSCLAQSVAIGNCQDGICVEEALDGTNYRLSTGVTFTTVDRAAALANNRVVIGAIPFRLLQVDERKTYDAYGGRLLYAVTESMTDRGTYNPRNGAIHIVNAQGDSLLDPPGSAPFLILSHGPNQLGSYTTNGSMTEECGGTTLDAENCFVFDPGTVTLPPILPLNPPLSVFVAEYRSDAQGVNRYDDVIDYFVESEPAKWVRTETNSQDMQAIVEDGVGIDTLNPTDALVVPLATFNYDHDNNISTAAIAHTAGLRAENSIQAQAFCELDGSNCFDPRRLGGDVAEGMGCTNPGEYMMGIEGGSSGEMGTAICAPIRVFCTSSSAPVMTGINSSGDPVCAAKPLTPCNGLSVQVCAAGPPLSIYRRDSNQVPITNPIAMPNRNHGSYEWATDTGSYALNQRRARFYCNNGVWRYSSGETGICNCDVPPDTSNQWVNGACPGESPSGNAALLEQSWDALNCRWVYTGASDYTACLCPGPVTAQPPDSPAACGTGYNIGNETTTYSFNNANNVCAWEPSITNTCGCDAAIEGTTDGGTRTDTTPYSCDVAMGTGYVGTAYRIQTFSATPGVCSWSNTGWDTSGCSCDTTTEHFSHNVTTCDLACEDETRPEKWYYRFEIDGGGNCVPGAPYPGTGPTDAAICTTSAFVWKSTGGALGGEGGIQMGPKLGSGTPSCTCAQKGNTGACWVETSPSKYTHYPCTCNR
ncbi:MAG: type II secretion system protein [Micavibrio sp.]